METIDDSNLLDALVLEQADDRCRIHLTAASLHPSKTPLLAQTLSKALEGTPHKRLVFSFENGEPLAAFRTDPPARSVHPAVDFSLAPRSQRRVDPGTNLWVG